VLQGGANLNEVLEFSGTGGDGDNLGVRRLVRDRSTAVGCGEKRGEIGEIEGSCSSGALEQIVGLRTQMLRMLQKRNSLKGKASEKRVAVDGGRVGDVFVHKRKGSSGRYGVFECR